MNDWELLKEFAATGSDSAFERLVTRYGGLVHSVALRHVHDPHRAQDVAQAVFILLAQRAGNLREGTVLSGWLFRTTRFVAQRANRSEQRRQHREKEAVTMNEHSSADQTWQRIAPVVDEAMEQLGTTDRNALLLRFFEGRNLREVGSAFGVAEEAAKKRVARALEKLRSIMVRRGWHLSTTLLAAAMAEQANASITPQLAAQFAASAMGSAPPATAAALADQVIAAWRWMKIRLAMGVGVATLSIATLFVLAKPDQPQTTAGLAPSPTPPPVFESASDAAVATPTPEAPSEMKLLRFRVVSAQSGAGLANARVGVAAWGNPDRWDVKTDTNGWCDIRYPDTVARLDVGAVADGWAPRFVTWPAEGSSQFAQEYTLRLEAVTNVIGGWVRDPAGQPVADVGIHFQAHGTGDSAHRERPRERFGFIHSIPAVRTDANGRWSINFVPAQHPGFQIEARHPDYAATSVVNSDQQESELWAGTLVTTLNPALTLTGVVVDEQNAPIAGAKIQQREQGEVFRTDAAGTFRVPKLRPGPWAFTASAEGYAPARTTLEVVPKMAPVTVTLKAGSVLRILVLDEHDNAVPNATVGLQRWGEHFPSVLEWREKTGDDGRVEWRSAPGDAELELYARGDGFCWTRDIHLKADGEEHVVRLRRALEVYGRVVDAGKGFGIPDFRVVPRYGNRYHEAELSWFGGETVRGTNGLFKFTFIENVPPFHLRVIADGYEDWTSPDLTSSSPVSLDIALKRSQKSVRGTVLRPDGMPAVGAQVALLSLEHNVRLRNTKFEGNKRWIITADENGRFQFNVNPLAHSVAAVGPEGYAHLRLTDPSEAITLQLQPWGRVEGMVHESARLQPVKSIELYDPAADNYQGRVSLHGPGRIIPDEAGRFTVESVPPGQFCVFINSGLGIPFHHKTPIVVNPGETTEVTIADRNGPLVKGRFVAPSDKTIDWIKDRTVAHLALESSRSAPGWSSRDEGTLKAVDYWTSPIARQHVNSVTMISLRVADDGTFVSVERVPSGQYQLDAIFKSASLHNRVVTVSATDGHLPELDLGPIQLR